MYICTYIHFAHWFLFSSNRLYMTVFQPMRGQHESDMDSLIRKCERGHGAEGGASERRPHRADGGLLVAQLLLVPGHHVLDLQLLHDLLLLQVRVLLLGDGAGQLLRVGLGQAGLQLAHQGLPGGGTGGGRQKPGLASHSRPGNICFQQLSSPYLTMVFCCI